MNRRNVLYESPPEWTVREGERPPSKSRPQTSAAGLSAVISTVRHLHTQPGLVRGVKTLLQANQDGGVDCPSCAWPDPQERSLFEFCENGAKAFADETTKARIDGSFFAQHSVEELSRLSDFRLNRLGRLTEPLYLAPESLHYRPIDWHSAFDLLADRIRGARSPEACSFYTSGRASNEAAFLYGTLVRMLGTNNLPDCSNLCHESSGVALTQCIGIGKGTVTLDDFSRTDLILVIGQNPGTNHPRMLSALEQAKRNGSRIYSINPLAEAGLGRFQNPQDFLNPLIGWRTAAGGGTELCDGHLAVQVGGDLALFKALAKLLVEASRQGRPGVDMDFVQRHTVGYEAWLEELDGHRLEALLEMAGLELEEVARLASELASTDRIIFCWAMGLTQHVHSVPTIRALAQLALMRGAIGKPGAGLCPVRGHSNVQGDRTVGIEHRPRQEFLDALGREFGFSAPTEPGLDVAETIEAMNREEIDVFVSLGGNFLSASPDTGATASGLQSCDITAAVVTKLNRSHLVTGREALLLPCLGRTEIDLGARGPQFVTVENSMGKVHRSQGRLEPASPELRSEVSIVCGLARALGLPGPFDWDAAAGDYDIIRDSIERVVPGFEPFNQRVREANGFYLPNGPREGRFTTSSGKAEFAPVGLEVEAAPPGTLWLTTIRSHDQFNTTVYGYDDRYRGIRNSRRLVLISTEDLERSGLQGGDTVDLVSRYGGIERRAAGFALVAYPIPQGCCAAYFPEANPVVPVEHRDPQSGCPASKRIAVTLEPSPASRP